MELEGDQDDVSKLKTTACSSEENNCVSLKNLGIYIELLNGTLNVNQDLLYICASASAIPQKIELSQLENGKIIKILIPEKQLFGCFFHAFGQYSIKKLALNEQYQIIYFRKNEKKKYVENVGISKKFKIIKQAKIFIMGYSENFMNHPYDYIIVDEENPDFYKQNFEPVYKYLNLKEGLNIIKENKNKARISQMFSSQSFKTSKYNFSEKYDKSYVIEN